MFLLKQLGQGRFYKSRSRSDKGDNPHPEHGTRSTDGNGRSHTSQVARTHTRGHTHGKSLKRGDMLTLALCTLILNLVAYCVNCRIGQQPEHLAHHPELHKACFNSKPHATAYQRGNQHIAPNGIINLSNQFVHLCLVRIVYCKGVSG